MASWEIGRWRGALGVCGEDGCGGPGLRGGLLWGAGEWRRGRMQGFLVSALERDLGSRGLGLSHLCVLSEDIEKRSEISLWTEIGFVYAGFLILSSS